MRFINSVGIAIAQRDLLTAEQGLKADNVITDTVCFHCQQAAEKNMYSAIKMHINGLVEDNKTIPTSRSIAEFIAV